MSPARAAGGERAAGASPAPAPSSADSPRPLSDEELAAFRADVRAQGEELYRDLPWRNTRDPYAVWISEAMLQQTQVVRVLSRWERFLGRFPTLDALAAASTADVVAEWQGLGYNRRAIALKRAADICAAQHGGRLPEGVDALRALPGIGEATAAGITAFSRDVPCIYIETNVRAVFIDRFFPHAEKVSDAQLRPLVSQACPPTGVRSWYYALLDLGAYLKKTQVNPTRRAASYTRQSAFAGSRRQKRAWLVREVMAAPGLSGEALRERLSVAEAAAGRERVDAATFESIMADLAREGFFRQDEAGAWFSA